MATEEKIERLLLGKLGTTGVRFVSVHLDLSHVPSPPDWIHGRDHLGRGIVLIDEGLEDSPEAREVVSMILQDLAAGNCPEMVCAGRVSGRRGDGARAGGGNSAAWGTRNRQNDCRTRDCDDLGEAASSGGLPSPISGPLVARLIAVGLHQNGPVDGIADVGRRLDPA